MEYSWKLHQWTWDIEEITSKTSSTSNVVDLLKSKMKDLSSDIVKLLPILACLGASVEESVLVTVWDAYCRESQDDVPVQPLLAKTVEEGFLEKDGQSNYHFIHDKIQEASMSLADSDQLERLKTTLGRIFLDEFDDDLLEANLFIAVNLLNGGLAPTVLDDQLAMAGLNLRAAKKAVVASAFASAAKFALKGIEVLPQNNWVNNYNLTRELVSLCAEVEGYLGQFESMQMHCNEVQMHAKDLSDTFRVHNCLQDSYLDRHLNEEALQLGLDLLKELGHKFPKGKGSMTLATLSGLVKSKFSMNSRIPERIEALPMMIDPVKIQTMHTLDKCCTAAYLLMHDILALLIFKNVELTLKYGLSQYSPPAFSFMACFLIGVFNDLENAAMLASCAEKMMEKSRNTASRTVFLLSCIVLPWIRPPSDFLKVSFRRPPEN